VAVRRSHAAAAGFALAAASLSTDSRAAPPWAAWTASPVAADTSRLDDVERAALDRCGPADRGLLETARRLLAIKLAGGPMPEFDAIAFAQRASGEPHPWARAWTMSAPSLAAETVARFVDAWLADRGGPAGPLRRCGVASGRSPSGSRVIVAVTVDALADLNPLPTRARTGQWVAVEAPLHVRASGASVVVLGPHGAPRTVPTSLDGATVRARFALDSPGEFAVQVIADLSHGPRPVIEATLFADVDPAAAPESNVAPGEEEVEAGDGGPADRADADALWRMMVAARRSQGLDVPVRDARLDAVARAHATAMVAANELAHDVGDGAPLDRIRAVGLAPALAAENVAHARTPALAHRGIWNSPSHRANLLRPGSTLAGVGVVRDPRGEVWVAEEFTGGR
jgi:uncharacterized protein YkwD